MSLSALHSSKAARAVARALGLPPSSSPSECRFEALRATVWSLAAPSNKVHVSRVLGAALLTWRVLSAREEVGDEALRAELREGLSTLEDAGDLLQLSGGYWAPATLRFVRLPRSGFLLVGGAPSELLSLEEGVVEYHGPHRHLANLPRGLVDAVPVEEMDSWAVRPSARLEDWSRALINSLERQGYTPANSDSFEFYVPEAAKQGAPQSRRWSESAGNKPRTLLARRARLYGAREYRLVDVCDGRIIGTSDLHGVDVRRLMYALDLSASNPVCAQRTAEPRSEWVFTSELPRAEQRVFAALGTLTIPDDRPFERRWSFVRSEGLALDMLRALGIEVANHIQEDRR